MYNYSVIIPHYNSIKFLIRCICSIPLREDIQIIVVDDCSPDRDSVNVVAASFPHVKMILMEKNSGAGAARNTALPLAKGRWLIFADADDFFLPEAWVTFDKYVSSESEIVYFMSESVDAITLEPVTRSSTYNILVSSCDNISQDSKDRLRLRHDVPWGKMIRRALVERGKVTFDEVRYCNDTMFSTMTGLLANQIYSVHEPVYCVTNNDSSLTHQRSPQKDLVRYEVILRKNRLLADNGYAQWRVPIVAYLKSILISGDRQAIRDLIRLGRIYKVHYVPELYNWIVRQIKYALTGKKSDLINV